MSIENVNQFYQVVLQNSALQQQLQFAPDEASMVNLAVELGQQQGYDFTSEEVIQAIALAQPPAQTTGMVELADEQLEAVAGGKGPSEAILGGIGQAIGTVGGGILGIPLGGVYAAATHTDYGQAIKGSAEIVGAMLGAPLAVLGSKIDQGITKATS